MKKVQSSKGTVKTTARSASKKSSQVPKGNLWNYIEKNYPNIRKFSSDLKKND